jgi:hypothetical protein
MHGGNVVCAAGNLLLWLMMHGAENWKIKWEKKRERAIDTQKYMYSGEANR